MNKSVFCGSHALNLLFLSTYLTDISINFCVVLRLSFHFKDKIFPAELIAMLGSLSSVFILLIILLVNVVYIVISAYIFLALAAKDKKTLCCLWEMLLIIKNLLFLLLLKGRVLRT